MSQTLFSLVTAVSAVLFAVSLVLGLSHLACVHFGKQKCLGTTTQWVSMTIVSFLCMVIFSLFVDNVQLHINQLFKSLIYQ